MPIVSPGGIVTPADSDGWDLTTDLATMATSIDSAVSAANAGANAFKGTATDRGLFTSTATEGMLWQDTDGIKMIWRKQGVQWVPAVWRWSGTTIQMNSFGANAPDGFEWFSTTDNSEYVRVGGVWAIGGRVAAAVASGPGWTVYTEYQSHLHKQGGRCNLSTTLRLASGGTFDSMLTVPPGFRPIKSVFIGTFFSNTSGTARGVLYLDAGTGVVSSPPSYRTGTLSMNQYLPVIASWSLTE